MYYLCCYLPEGWFLAGLFLVFPSSYMICLHQSVHMRRYRRCILQMHGVTFPPQCLCIPAAERHSWCPLAARAQTRHGQVSQVKPLTFNVQRTADCCTSTNKNWLIVQFIEWETPKMSQLTIYHWDKAKVLTVMWNVILIQSKMVIDLLSLSLLTKSSLTG